MHPTCKNCSGCFGLKGFSTHEGLRHTSSDRGLKDCTNIMKTAPKATRPVIINGNEIDGVANSLPTELNKLVEDSSPIAIDKILTASQILALVLVLGINGEPRMAICDCSSASILSHHSPPPQNREHVRQT